MFWQRGLRGADWKVQWRLDVPSLAESYITKHIQLMRAGAANLTACCGLFSLFPALINNSRLFEQVRLKDRTTVVSHKNIETGLTCCKTFKLNEKFNDLVHKLQNDTQKCFLAGHHCETNIVDWVQSYLLTSIRSWGPCRHVYNNNYVVKDKGYDFREQCWLETGNKQLSTVWKSMLSLPA